MAQHISTDQIIKHIKTASSISVGGVIYDKITVDQTNLTIGDIVFPLDFFDVAGINPHTIILVDKDHTYRDIMLLDNTGYKMDHPKWEIEEYDPKRVRNSHIINNYKTK